MPDEPKGSVVLGDAVLIDGGRALTIDAAGQASIDGGAIIHADAVDLASIDLNLLAPDGTAGADIGAAALAAILRNTDNLTLRARDAITFWAPVDLRPAAGTRRLAALTLNAPVVAGRNLGGGTVSLDAATLTLTNDHQASGGAAAGGDGRLALSGDRVVITGGEKLVDGFDVVSLSATQAISVGDGKRAGGLAVPGTLLLEAPLVLAATGGTQTLTAAGDVVATNSGGRAVVGPIDDIGGKLVIEGAGVVIDTTVAALAGVLELSARSGDVELQDGARLLASGYTQSFLDKQVMLPGGSVTLRATTGNVLSRPDSLIDVAAAPGGNAGTLNVRVAGSFLSGGMVSGKADPGLSGGAFVLESGSAVDLDGIVAAIGAGGFDRRFSIRSAAGDLLLTRDLLAHDVTLAADGGAVVIAGSAAIDASGASGGRIALWGAGGVTLGSGAALLANADPTRPALSDDAPRGGQVEIGTGAGGLLQLLAGALIDVRGGSGYGSGGGTVHLRTPAVLADAAVLQATIVRSPITAVAGSPLTPVIFEPYSRIDLGGGDVTLSGADLQAILLGFTPSVDALQARYPDFAVQPGLELVAASGSITIGDGAIDLSALRFGTAQQPGWLSIRAAGNLTLDLSLSDGFTDATAAGELRTISFSDAIAGRVPFGLASWSYRFAAGARTDSADPLAVQISTEAGDLRFGDVAWVPTDTVAPLGRNDILRTGTGSIGIAAAGDVELLNPSAVIYTAGVGVDWATIPGFVDLPLSLLDPRWRDLVFLYTRAGAGARGVDPALAGLRGTLPALPTLGGDLDIAAGGDLIGHQNITDVSGQATARAGIPLAERGRTYIGQVFSPWLYFQGAASLSPDASGQFGGDAAALPGSVPPTFPAIQTAAWVTTGTFQQGIAALGGGDITVQTGGAVRDVSLSVVSTYAAAGGKSAGEAVTLHRFGGGDLRIDAGGDISSSIIYVGKGRGEIHSDGSLIAGYSVPLGSASTPIEGIPIGSTLGLGDASLEVAVRGNAVIGQVLSDTAVERFALDIPPAGDKSNRRAPRLSAYGVSNRLVVHSTSGNVGLSTEAPAASTYGSRPFDTFRSNFAPYNINNYLPPRVEMVAARGDIVLRNQSWMALAPSPIGSLDLLAQNSISYAFRRLPGVADANANAISLLDIDPAVLSNPVNPNTFLDLVLPVFGRGYRIDAENTEDPRLNRFTLHAGPIPLHFDDPAPVRVIALEGDIVSGPGFGTNPVDGVSAGQGGALFFNKKSQIFAGRDIVNMTFTGENNRDSDVTALRAGRDITFALENLDAPGGTVAVPAGGSFTIGGPGTFILEAGRNLEIRPSTPDVFANPPFNQTLLVHQQQFGVLAVGNRINPYRQAESADIAILFGSGPGKDIPGFIDRYIDPAAAVGVEKNYIDDLVAFMTQRAADFGTPTTFTPERALAEFRALAQDEQLPLIGKVYFAELRSIVPGPDAIFTVNQRRAFEAVAALFPAGLGYSDQLATDTEPVRTGEFDMVNAVMRTDYGSSIGILGPGGNAQIGGFTVDATLPLNYQGIFTLRGGAIDVALDGSFNVNNSRVITTQGGDITIFTANGDIDAGRGAKTASFSPPIKPFYSAETQAAVDFGGVITGSGIGTLVTLPGGEVGDVFLIAPRGTVDAGEGGIRAAGNLAIVAVQVLNASNVQVGGASVGLPQGTASPAGALSSSQGTQAALGNQALDQIATAAGSQAIAGALPSIVTVEVLSFGE